MVVLFCWTRHVLSNILSDQMFQIRIHLVNMMAKIIFRSDILPSITRLMIWVN